MVPGGARCPCGVPVARARGFAGMIALLLACAVGAGCSGKVALGSPSRDAGADAGPDLSHLTCDELGNRAGAELSRALETKADRGCQADTDCELVLAGTRCTNGCGPLDRRRAVESIRSTISQIDGDVCSVFVQKGCRIIEPPCLAPMMLGACVSGACESIPPADWQELDIDEGFGPCPPGQSCVSSWKLTPDGSLTTDKQGVPGHATLSADDLRAADAILRTASFRRSMANGFQCDPPPTDVGISFTLRSPNTTGGFEEAHQDVTGCALSGPKGNDAERLFAILQKY